MGEGLRKIYHWAQHWYVKAAVSILLLWFVISRAHIPAILSSIGHITISSLLIYLLLMVVVTILAAWRWLLWLAPQQRLQYFSPLIRATAISYLYNLFMPGTVGGDALKWTNLLHLGFSKRKLISSVILDRVSGLLGLIIFGFASVVTMKMWGSVELNKDLFVLFLVAFSAAIGLLLLNGSHWYLSKLPFLRRFHSLQRAEHYLKEQRKAMMYTVAITIFIQFVSFFGYYILSEGLQLHVQLWYYFTLGSIISFLLLIPISFSGFGVTELSFVYFFTQIGATKEGILALTAILNIFKFVLAFLGWMYHFCFQVRDRLRMRRGAKPVLLVNK